MALLRVLMFKFKPQIWNYGVAIASVIFAAGLMLALNPYIELTQASFLLFFGAVTVSAWYGGRNPGLLATFLSALFAKYFFLEPLFSLSLTFAGGIRMGLFVFQGYLISNLVGSLRIAQQQSRRSLEQLQESQARFRRLVDSNIIGVVSGDIYGAIHEVNDEFLRMTGFTQEDVRAGRVRWDQMTPPDLRDRDVLALEELQKAGKSTAYEKAFIGKDEQQIPVIVGAASLHNEPESLISFVLDLSKRKRAEQRLAVQYAVARVLAEASTLADAISLVLRSICENLGWQLGFIWQVDPQSNRLRYLNSWHTPDLNLTALVIANQATTFALGVGLPGRIWESGESTWIANLAEDENFPRAAIALDLGLHSVFGFPVSLGHEILGVIECFSTRYQEPDEDLLHMMSAIGSQIGQFMERKQAEEELQASQALFQSFMNYSPTNAFIKDELGRYLYVNPLVERSFNRPLAEWIGKTDFDCFPHETAQAMRDNDLAVLRAGEVTQLAESVPLADGEHYYLAFKFPLKDADGRQLLAGIAVDITDRKQAELEIQKFVSLADNSTEFIGMCDMNFVPFYVNDAGKQMVGLDDTQQYNETPVREFFFPEDQDFIINEFFPRVFCEGRAEMEIRFRHFKTGEALWMIYNVFYITGKNNQPIGLATVSRNITARKQAEIEREQLLARERHYMNQLQGLTTAALAINSALSVEQLLQVITDQAASTIGTHQAVTTMTIDYKWTQAITAFHLSDKYAAWRNYDAQPDGSGIYACVCHLNRPMRMTQAELEVHPYWRGFGKEAEKHPPMRGWLAAPLLGRDGHNIGLIQLSDKYEGEFTEADEAILVQLAQMASVAVENARLYEAEQQARSAAEASQEAAQAANRIKDEFLAVLSHELRSPLNPILGWSQLLQSGKLNATKTAQALSVIERNARLQSQLIEDLLDVSRILRGKLSLNVVAVDLAAIIQSAMETVRLAVEAKSIQIQHKLDPEVGQVSGDSARLQQIVWNLLSNAVKFTPEGGRVDVRLERHGTFAQITVSDTGQGISADFLPFVFDYFRQADSTTTRRFGGLGLGLAIVHHLVELHGGTVQADSPGEGQGAKFTVRLPLLCNLSQVKQNSQSSELSVDLSGVQVLFVDDDADTREFVAFLLEQAGAGVTTATTASEALAILKRSQPDVLISDIGMPDMDGYTLMRQVRALPLEQGGQIPAIALTAYAGEFNQQQALQAGFQQHISKPLEAEILLRMITNLIRDN